MGFEFDHQKSQINKKSTTLTSLRHKNYGLILFELLFRQNLLKKKDIC